MAESLVNSSDNETDEAAGKTDKTEPQLQKEGLPGIPDCAVCLQTCVHPARLPCSHIFCFLCLKGLVTQGSRCAMCRQEIPPDYLVHPQLLEYPQTLEKDPQAYKWFYEGRNGWWQYDERNTNELEAAYTNEQRSCELLIAGTLYVANFDGMMQFQKNDRSRWRRIKRDLATVPKKGVAGLRIDVVLPSPPTTDPDEPSPDSNSTGNLVSFTSYRRPALLDDSDSDTSDGYSLGTQDDEPLRLRPGISPSLPTIPPPMMSAPVMNLSLQEDDLAISVRSCSSDELEESTDPSSLSQRDAKDSSPSSPSQRDTKDSSVPSSPSLRDSAVSPDSLLNWHPPCELDAAYAEYSKWCEEENRLYEENSSDSE